MKSFFLAVFFCLAGTALTAQERIETDRPDQTETPFLVPRGWFQAEVGFNKENHDNNDYILVLPTALLKYGVSKKFEARLEVNELSEHAQLIPNPKTTTGLSPVEIGAKIFLAEERGLRPKTSFIAHVGMPFLGSRPFRTPHLSPSFRFTMQNSLTNAIALGYNVGAEWNGISTTPSWLYTFAPGFNLGERWYAYVEAFGYITKGEMPQHNFDGGITYFLSNNAKLDVSGGVGLSPESFKNYVAVGFSFRIPVAKSRQAAKEE
jgi:hypothetical protein